MTAPLEGQLALDVTPTPTGPPCPRCERPMRRWTDITVRCVDCRCEVTRPEEGRS